MSLKEDYFQQVRQFITEKSLLGKLIVTPNIREQYSRN